MTHLNVFTLLYSSDMILFSDETGHKQSPLQINFKGLD